MNYYALGDRTRARGFLERALAIRTVALDGRGRMATLRALATIDAEQGRVDDAIASDREALGLAVDPSAIERIRIQLAVHTAAVGHPVEAKAQLDEVLYGREGRSAHPRGGAPAARGRASGDGSAPRGPGGSRGRSTAPAQVWQCH